MARKDISTEESPAVIDATFQQGPLAPPPQASASVPSPPEDSQTTGPVPAEPTGSPLRDYVRELQQEFETQEEEGKL